jgi:hypothetical protein
MREPGTIAARASLPDWTLIAAFALVGVGAPKEVARLT